MISFINVCKSFGDYSVLKNINLKLPRSGLVVIKGPSGCGKTTLLNLLSGLIPFDGDIEVDGHHLGLMGQKELDEFRLKNYGFIFQDFKLFENETVMNNIIFPLEVISSASADTKERKCASLISIVGLKSSAKQRVGNLSGGEKQRVAIARALVNSPKIVLADEPTGALDTKTGNEIMKIFQAISSHSLVIVVSHDDNLATEYGDLIIEMKDGIITNTIKQEKEKKEKYIPISKMFYSPKRPAIPSSFLFNHTLSSLKQKKWRTSICNMVTSLGLIGVGLATSLSSAISSNIKKSYSQIIDESKITMTLKNHESSLHGVYAASYYEASELAEAHQEYIYDIGCTYYTDFESFFPHTNCIAIADTNYYAPIEGISARHINEFRWLDVEHPDKIYPEDIDYLRNDQVVLALTIDMIYDICFELRIVRTVSSLSAYLQTNELKMYFDLKNNNWQYEDQQLFEVVGFTLDIKPGIYHNNHMWNEYMFEERMRFPVTDQISGQGAYPWIMKKIYYFYCKTEVEDFLKMSRKDTGFDELILEIANESYYPWLMQDIPKNTRKRVLIFANSLRLLSETYFQLVQSVEKEINNPIFGSNGGYAIYPSAMMYGFSNFMYFSGSKESMEETIDINTTLTTNDNENVDLPDDVMCGHYSQTLNGGVNFRVFDDGLIKGNPPNDLSEIVISSSMDAKMFENDGLGKSLYVSYLSSLSKNANGNVIRHFDTVELTVCGVREDEKNTIYHNEDWSIGFFQVMLGVSAFNLGINSMMVEAKNQKNIDKIASNIKRAFPELDVENPMSEINASINQVCFYIEIALMCFSIIAVTISVLLLSICNYLYILENRKDIGLVRCIGVSKNEAKKFVVTHSLIMSFVSFVLSSFELLGTSFLISWELSQQMGTAFEFSFNPMSLVYMFALAFSISIFSSLFISHRANKLDPISVLKS